MKSEILKVQGMSCPLQSQCGRNSITIEGVEEADKRFVIGRR